MTKEHGLNSPASLTSSSSGEATPSAPGSKSQSQILNLILRDIAAQLDYVALIQNSTDPIATGGYVRCLRSVASHIFIHTKALT
jgi:hypothetical protein